MFAFREEDIREYVLNQVIKIAVPKKAFGWKEIIKNIADEIEPDKNEPSIERKFLGLYLIGGEFRTELEILLSKRYIVPSKKEVNRYLLSNTIGVGAKEFGNLTEFENCQAKKSKIENNKFLKKFNKKVISYLRSQPQESGDISQVVNRFIDQKQLDANIIYKQLIHLRDTLDIIEIKELPDDDTFQAQNNWWGNLIGVNTQRGDKVVGLSAKLTGNYLKLSWFDRNRIIDKLSGWVIPCIITYFLGLFTCNVAQHNNNPALIKYDTIHIIPDQKVYGNDTNYDSVHHNKDSVSLNKTTTPTK